MSQLQYTFFSSPFIKTTEKNIKNTFIYHHIHNPQATNHQSVHVGCLPSDSTYITSSLDSTSVGERGKKSNNKNIRNEETQTAFTSVRLHVPLKQFSFSTYAVHILFSMHSFIAQTQPWQRHKENAIYRAATTKCTRTYAVHVYAQFFSSLSSLNTTSEFSRLKCSTAYVLSSHKYSQFFFLVFYQKKGKKKKFAAAN